MNDEEPPNSSEQTGSPPRRHRSEWLSIGTLAAVTLAIIYAWVAAAWWLASLVLGWIW